MKMNLQETQLMFNLKARILTRNQRNTTRIDHISAIQEQDILCSALPPPLVLLIHLPWIYIVILRRHRVFHGW
jgi:hypothetical protein